MRFEDDLRGTILQFATPPRSPKDYAFALPPKHCARPETKIAPCQFGGSPDCGSYGSVASVGLTAVAADKLGGLIGLRTAGQMTSIRRISVRQRLLRSLLAAFTSLGVLLTIVTATPFDSWWGT
jgi:hypothetical protein